MNIILRHCRDAHLRCIAAAVGGLASLCSPAAQAAEDFQVRYNLAGALGGEMFAPPEEKGWWTGAALTAVNITKVTGGDGKDLRTQIQGGSVPLADGGTPVDPTYDAQTVTLKAKGPLMMLNLALGFISDAEYAGGRLVFALNLPLGYKKQTITLHGDTPALNWPVPGVPDDATREAVTSAFGSQYQAGLAAQGQAQSGDVTGLGDVELTGGWLCNTPQWRFVAGASLVAPTGKYSANRGVDFGFGNYYTFRPGVQVAYLPTEQWAIAGKLSMGLNTRNKDTDLRSGNWVGLESAIGYKTPLGPVGLHAVFIQQVQDDSRNSFGAARFKSQNAGVFFTTKIPDVDLVVTAQTMATFDSRYAKHGTFSQIRFLMPL